MKKEVLIPIIVASILIVVAGTSVGLWYAATPIEDSELAIVSVTTEAENDIVNVILTCEGNQSGNTHRFRNHFAFMYKIQFKNSTTDETLYQEQYNWQWRHRIQAGKNYAYQFHIEGLEEGQMLQLRIEYYNGKVLTHTFVVNS